MQLEEAVKNFIPSFIKALYKSWEAVEFIRTHRLWKGFLSYGWVVWILLAAGLIVSLKFFSVFLDWMDSISLTDPSTITHNAGMLFTNVAHEGYELFFMGGMKYIILILSEILIFHITRRTLEILTGEVQDTSFNTFVQAQIRMIKVVIRSWIKELIATIFISVVTSMFDVEFVEAPLTFVVQCYYLGFAVMDNYNERYHLTITESIKRIEPLAGAALGIGVVFYILLLLPGLGSFIAPVFTAVAATLLMHHLDITGQLPAIVREEPVAEGIVE